MIWLALAACTGPKDDDTNDTDVVDTDDTDDTDEPIPTADTAPVDPYDCAHPAEVPLEWTTLQGFGDAEDFDFDREGRHVSVGVDGNLVARALDGTQTLLAPNVASGFFGTACTRRLPNGMFVICDVGSGSLTKVDPATGEVTTLASGMNYPNGGEVDPEGYVYVAEQSAGRIRRVNSETSEESIVALGLDNPNGVIFSPDYQTLYAGSFGAGIIYAIDRLGPNEWDDPRVLIQRPGGAGFDGINVDVCGNVYITEYGPGFVGRVSPDGQEAVLAADLPSGWIPNMRWGNGIGGFEENTLYVSDRDQGRLFALDVGIPGKPDFPDP